MSRWTALVPVRLGGKSRLGTRLSEPERRRLAEAMARHVVAQLEAVAAIGGVRLLATEPPWPGAQWIADRGRGLNAELAAALGSAPALIVHADLPLLAAAEVADLLAAAETAGAAIAPDRHASGTNALALRAPGGLLPAFGADSFVRHRALLPGAGIVERPGLALDLDTPEDLALALAAGAIARPI